MSTATSSSNSALKPIFGDYFPGEVLYQDAEVEPLFKSPHSAAWFIRNNKPELARAGAIAIHAGKMYVNPARFAIVAEKAAVRMAQAMYSRK